jgi:peptidoglycan L-alanyl-D-glutamate endopeptidase CwlK
MDSVTLNRIEQLHPLLRDEAKEIYQEICEALKGRAICRFAFTLRSFKEQNDLYAQGRTRLFDANGNRLGVVTKAKGGQSIHNYGLALDIVLLRDRDGNGTFETASWENNIDFDKDGKADWLEIVTIFEKYGWEWGGRWSKPKTDTPHFQKTLGLTVTKLNALPKKGAYPLI